MCTSFLRMFIWCPVEQVKAVSTNEADEADNENGNLFSFIPAHSVFLHRIHICGCLARKLAPLPNTPAFIYSYANNNHNNHSSFKWTCIFHSTQMAILYFCEWIFSVCHLQYISIGANVRDLLIVFTQAFDIHYDLIRFFLPSRMFLTNVTIRQGLIHILVFVPGFGGTTTMCDAFEPHERLLLPALNHFSPFPPSIHLKHFAIFRPTIKP